MGTKVKKIRNKEELSELKIEDIVNVLNYDEMLCYAISIDSYTFLGRSVLREEIHELEVAKGSLIPIDPGNGNYLSASKILSERIYHINHPLYILKNKTLGERGL